MRRTLSPVAIILGVSLALLTEPAAPAAAWAGATVESQWSLSRPSLRVDGADHTGIAYARNGKDPGILFASDAGGGWATTRVSSGDDWTPALAYGASNHAHVLFARASGAPGIYETTDATGSWAAPTLVANDIDPWSPALAIDGANHLQAVYTSMFSFAPGLYYLTNATGIWVRTRITAATWASEPDLVLDGGGHAHVVFARYAPESRGIYYATNATGSWAVTRISTAYDDDPSLVLDGAGKVHVAFSRFGGGTRSAYHATNATGSWVVTQLPPYLAASYGATAIGFDGAGKLHVWGAQWATDVVNDGYSGIYDWKLDGGTWSIQRAATDGAILSDDNPSMDALADGTIRLAFDRSAPTAGIRIWDGASGSTLVDGGHLALGPGIDLGPTGTRHVAFERRDATSHTIVHASSAGSTWSAQDAGSAGYYPVRADIAVAGDDSVRIVDGDTYWSNGTGPWTSDMSVPTWGPSQVEVDASGHSHIAFSEPYDLYWDVWYRTDTTGSWVDEEVYLATFGFAPMPALALDTAGRPHVVFAWGGSELSYTKRVSGSWTTPTRVSSQNSAWPAIAVDGAGKAHIAYMDTGSAPGIWYATNKSGSWTRTRLTRSNADGPPSIGLDATGHVYVSTTRDASAANPGVYLATNASGSWAVQRVVAAFDAGSVSLSMTGDGAARMVLSTTEAIVDYESGPGLAAQEWLGTGTPAALLRDQLQRSMARGEAPAGASGTRSAEPASAPTFSGGRAARR